MNISAQASEANWINSLKECMKCSKLLRYTPDRRFNFSRSEFQIYPSCYPNLFIKEYLTRLRLISKFWSRRKIPMNFQRSGDRNRGDLLHSSCRSLDLPYKWLMTPLILCEICNATETWDYEVINLRKSNKMWRIWGILAQRLSTRNFLPRKNLVFSFRNHLHAPDRYCGMIIGIVVKYAFVGAKARSPASSFRSISPLQ